MISTAHPLTGRDLREAVFGVIRKELGPDALVRFIAENLSQPGRDYTEERLQQPGESVQQVAEGIAALKAQRGGRLAPPGARIVEQ